MASAAQVLANRLNAQKSTGPRTGAGKAVVAQNAVRHGLLARQAVIRGEDPGEFEFYRDQMLGELAPAGAMESMLAERAVGLAWRLRRAERIQAEVFDALLEEDATNPVRKLLRSMRRRGANDGKDRSDDGDLALGRAVVRDFANARVLDRLGMYERRIEHSLYRTMGELQRLRLLRELDPPREEPTPEPAGAEPLCETKPISRDTNASAPARDPAPRADKGRSCLTRGSGLGMIPHSERSADRDMGSGDSAVRVIVVEEKSTEMARASRGRLGRGLNLEGLRRL